MDELQELLRPSWGAEKWILEGWQTLTLDEKQLIQQRMHDLFKNGLPFELKKEKLLYIYTFSLLAQLEVLAIQIPLKFESKMTKLEHRQRLRVQLLDEIFHGLVFTKIVYMLCSPLAAPPEYNPAIEQMCNFIREEQCPKVAIMLLNLIGEGWIEEIFYSLHHFNIAPNVFDIILQDEHRHVCEADLYQDIGMPDLKIIQPKIAYLEDQLLTNVFMQYKYTFSVSVLLGTEGMKYFKQSLHNKHVKQLKKINLTPSHHWKFFMTFGDELLPKIQEYTDKNHQVEMTPMRKVLMSQWSNPMDPTMVGQFNLDISCLDFFNKKFPSHVLTTLMLQAISLFLTKHHSLKNYINFQEIFHSEDSYVGLVVQLPQCKDHMGTIVFRNCHLWNMNDLAEKIQFIIQMMVFCYKKREYLENTNDRVKQLINTLTDEYRNSTYLIPIPSSSVVSFSNIGSWKFEQCISPLRFNESVKITTNSVNKQLVWDKNTQSFVPKDLLPVSISADHRVFDGNIALPTLLEESFHTLFNKMLNEQNDKSNVNCNQQFEELIELLIEQNIDMGYKTLVALQTYWCDFVSFGDILMNTFSLEQIEESMLE